MARCRSTTTISYNDDYGSHTVSETSDDHDRSHHPASPLAALAVLLIGIIAGAAYWYYRIRQGKEHA